MADRNDIEKRLSEAREILTAFGLPNEQRNERAALTLLALLDLMPTDPWSKAQSPLMGVTPIMEFAAKHYGQSWAPNTRETVRRFTLHQFVQAGLAVPNPDEPIRPTNSPHYCYQIAPEALNVMRRHGSKSWDAALRKYLAKVGMLAQKYVDRAGLHKYLSDVAWETEVWAASDPDHMIHFNGERFLGPY